MPKKLEKIQIYPKLVKWATLFRANPVIILLQVNSLTLNNLHYIVLALCKAAKTAQVKEKIENLVF
jgi:hypothetical protein